MSPEVGPGAGLSSGALRVKPWGHERIVAGGGHGCVGTLISVDAGAAPGRREDTVRLADRHGRGGTTRP